MLYGEHVLFTRIAGTAIQLGFLGFPLHRLQVFDRSYQHQPARVGVDDWSTGCPASFQSERQLYG
jgi:hypothetical protein